LTISLNHEVIPLELHTTAQQLQSVRAARVPAGIPNVLQQDGCSWHRTLSTPVPW